jgi:hypothetical protein
LAIWSYTTNTNACILPGFRGMCLCSCTVFPPLELPLVVHEFRCTCSWTEVRLSSFWASAAQLINDKGKLEWWVIRGYIGYIGYIVADRFTCGLTFRCLVSHYGPVLDQNWIKTFEFLKLIVKVIFFCSVVCCLSVKIKLCYLLTSFEGYKEEYVKSHLHKESKYRIRRTKFRCKFTGYVTLTPKTLSFRIETFICSILTLV